MKILLVGSDAGMSGAGLSMIALADELSKIGHTIIIVVRKGNTEQVLRKRGIPHYIVNAQAWTEPIDRNRWKNAIIRTIKKIKNIRPYFQMKKIIKDEKPDIVHINTSSTYVAAKAAIKASKTIVWHFREFLEEDFNSRFWNKNLSILYFNKADEIITISQALREKYYSLVSTRIDVVYNGVDVDKYYIPEHEIFTTEKTIITIAGRITRYKGQFFTLCSLTELLKTQKIELWIAGNGDDEETKRIINYIDQSGIPADRVKLLGYIEDMPRIWEKTDIAIVASKCEAFGRVTVEAMCAGCLVIGARSGCTVELLKNGNGLLYLSDDKTSLKEIVTYAIKNKTEMREIASKGRRVASSVFTSSNNAKKISNIYNMIINRN